MDRPDQPWRVFEQADQPVAAGAAVAMAPDDGSARTDPDRGVRDAGSTYLPPVAMVGAAVIAVAVALLGAALVIVLGGPSPSIVVPAGIGSDDPGSETTPPGSSSGTELVVEVAGAVARPGLYRLAAGVRVADAIAAAGGYGPRVDIGRATARLNLAARLADGDRVVVPSRDDPETGSPTSAGSAGTGSDDGAAGSGPSHDAGRPGPVDLNHATAAELDALPGIGPVTAAKIIAARAEARFTSVDELDRARSSGRPRSRSCATSWWPGSHPGSRSVPRSAWLARGATASALAGGCSPGRSSPSSWSWSRRSWESSCAGGRAAATGACARAWDQPRSARSSSPCGSRS